MSEARPKLLRRILARLGLPSIGARLSFTLLPLVLLPALIIGSATFNRARSALVEQAVSQLASSTQAQVEALDTWARAREHRLQLGSQRTDLRDPLVTLINSFKGTAEYDEAENRILAQLRDIRAREAEVLFSHVFVVRVPEWTILSSTNPDWVGVRLSPVLEGRLSTGIIMTRPIFNDPLLGEDRLALVSATPFRVGGGEQPDAVLVGVNSDTQLGRLMEQMQAFWEQRGAYRIQRGETLLALAPDTIFRLSRYAVAPEANKGVDHPVFSLAQMETSGSAEYVNLDGVDVLGTYEWLPEWEMGVVIQIPRSDVLAAVEGMVPFTLTAVIGTAALSVLAVLITTRYVLRPLATLTGLIDRAGEGDLLQRVPFEREDEVGRLAKAFNRMSGELLDVYRSLEHRVQARTRQLMTAAEVAMEAASIRDIQSLADAAVNLISERFDYYHAGLFLLDESGEHAILRAASSEGGKHLIQQGYNLPVGKAGLVGYVTGSGGRRIIDDVSKDSAHLPNPELPDTRSQLALPLVIGGRVIGALDVQSTEVKAFTEEDALALQTMADQLAIALENARLMEHQTQVVASRHRVIEVYRALATQTDYDQLLSDGPRVIRETFDYTLVLVALQEGEEEIVAKGISIIPGEGQLPPARQAALLQGVLEQVVRTRTPVTYGIDRSAGVLNIHAPLDGVAAGLCVPLVSRGKVLGTLVAESDSRSFPTGDDTAILEMLASLLAVALENARLFEETQVNLRQLDTLYRERTSQAWASLLASPALGEGEVRFGSRGDEALRAGAGSEAGLSAPISLRGEVIGNIDLGLPKSTELSDDDQAVLEAVASEVAEQLEQVRLMEEIWRRATQLQTAAEIARDATGLLDTETLLRRAVNLISERFGFYHTAVYLMDADKRRAFIQESSSPQGEKLKADRHFVDLASKSVVARATQLRKAYAAQDASADSFYQEIPGLSETRSELGVPLRLGDRIIGALDVHHTQTHAFGQDVVAVLEILADQLAVAIQNARLYREAVTRAERERAIVDITSKIRASEDIDRMLQTAVQEMRKALGASRAAIRLSASHNLQDVEKDKGDGRAEAS